MNQSIAAHTILGFGAGNCQLAAFALPELLPNKWRHFAVVIADGGVLFTVIVGPPTARLAILHGSAVSSCLVYIKVWLFNHTLSGAGATGEQWSWSESRSSFSSLSTSLRSILEVFLGTKPWGSWTTLELLLSPPPQPQHSPGLSTSSFSLRAILSSLGCYARDSACLWSSPYGKPSCRSKSP